MGHKTRFVPMLAAACGILMFVTDSRTVMQAAMEAVELCVKTVIPALFPMFFLCILLTGNLSLTSEKLRGRHANGKASFVPFLICGFLGGYPTGAKSVAQACASGRLCKEDAASLLACCNQAGPAFILGILGTQFDAEFAPIAIWSVQLLSAIVLFLFWQPKSIVVTKNVYSASLSAADALNITASAIAKVCGWVVLFRGLIGWCGKILKCLPAALQTILVGVLELTNGCIQLRTIQNEGVRFILCSALLTFGGICVIFQTMAVMGDLPIQKYLKGKIVQSSFSLSISACTASLLFPGQLPWPVPIFAAVFILILAFYARKGKIVVDFPAKEVYNNADKA